WDETRVLPGSEPGKVAVFARRSGQQWFVAILNGAEPTEFSVSLDFLETGSWRLTRIDDVEGQANAWTRTEVSVKPDQVLRTRLPARGGFVARLVREYPKHLATPAPCFAPSASSCLDSFGCRLSGCSRPAPPPSALRSLRRPRRRSRGR